MTDSAKEILRREYSRVLIPEADGRFSAQVLELPGCFSQGESPQEAYDNLEEAALNWIEAALERGISVPDPTPSYSASGRFALRLPRALHGRLKQVAALEGVSLNQFIVTTLASATGAAELAERLEQRLLRSASLLVGVEITASNQGFRIGSETRTVQEEAATSSGSRYDA